MDGREWTRAKMIDARPGACPQFAAITDDRTGAQRSHRYPNDRTYTVNEEPQPQVVFAFGLRITNCAPLSDSA